MSASRDHPAPGRREGAGVQGPGIPRHALVTGAGGFVGRELCARLRARGIAVTALHRHPREGPWDREFVHDLGASPPPAAALREVDTVFHLAGHAHARETRDAGAVHERVSVRGTRHLLAACGPGVQRLLFVSSVKAMGEWTPPGCVDEDAPAHPVTAYGRSRLDAERLVLAAGGPRHAVVLRLPLVYGAGARGNLDRMLRALAARRMPRLPDFGNRRSMIHVADVCEAAIAAVTSPACAGRVYLLCDGEPYSPPAVQALMCRALGRPPPRVAVPAWALILAARAGDVLHAAGWQRVPFDSQALARLRESACYRADRARADFGFAPRHRLADALDGMARGYRTP